MASRIDQIIEKIFGNLGIELDLPKDYAINIVNYLIREMSEIEWTGFVQIDSIEYNDSSAEILIFTLDGSIPMDISVKVTRNMDYSSKGIIFTTYDLSVEIETTLEKKTTEFHKAESFILSCSIDDALRNLYAPSIELEEGGTYLLKGMIENGFNVSFIPLSSDNLETYEIENWPSYLKERTNFNSIAHELSNFKLLLQTHYNEVQGVLRWFRERNYSRKR